MRLLEVEAPQGNRLISEARNDFGGLTTVPW